MAPARVKWLTVGGELAVAGGCLAWGFSTGWAPLAAILPTWASLSLAVPVAAGVFGTPAPAPPSAGVLPAPPGGAAPYGAKLVFMPGTAEVRFAEDRGVYSSCSWEISEVSGGFRIVRALLAKRGWRTRGDVEGHISTLDGHVQAWFPTPEPRGKPHREQAHRDVRGTVSLVDSRNGQHRYSGVRFRNRLL
jgi:hypothetical protein